MLVSFYKGFLLVLEDRSSLRDRCCLLFFILLVLLKFLYSLVFSCFYALGFLCLSGAHWVAPCTKEWLLLPGTLEHSPGDA
jgi:hypothetical protein